MSYISGMVLDRVRTSAEGPEFKLGSIGQSYDGKKYKYVQYDTGAGSVAAVAGNVAFYYGVSGASAGDTTKVTSDVTDSVGVGAGVLQAVIADEGYGWVQITGPATLTTALTAGADGNALTAVGAGDGTLDVSALVTDSVVAYAIDASAKIVMCAFPE
ncbi:MAG TPA: hypothetical protein VF389_04415 [Woeseiaceae bacterium]